YSSRHLLRGAHVLQFHAELEAARAEPQLRRCCGRAAAVLRVGIGLHLEDKAGDLRLFGPDWARPDQLRARHRGQCGDPAQQLSHAKIIERASGAALIFCQYGETMRPDSFRPPGIVEWNARPNTPSLTDILHYTDLPDYDHRPTNRAAD